MEPEAKDLTIEEIKKAIEYYEYWKNYMKTTGIKALDKEELEWLEELKEELRKRNENDIR